MMKHKPMLAYPVSDKPIDYSEPVFVQPKLDGVRCLIQCDKGVVTAWSRTGKPWLNIDHILFNLQPFFKFHPNVVLDGELYNHDLRDNFEKIISCVRKTKPTDQHRFESAQLVQFHCYDTIMEHWNFEDRNLFINENFGHYGKFELSTVVPLPSYLVRNTEEVEVNHEDFLELGYEGSILRKNEKYECKRSWTLMKVKDFSDAEATIVGYEEGKGKRINTLGKFIMEDDNGVQFGCPPGKGYNYKDMGDMLENIHDYIGERATFTYFERTKAGSYRHPLFKGLRNYE